MVGLVVGNKMTKTVVVAVEKNIRHPLYNKIVRRTRRYKAHDATNALKLGDVVRIMETRPLSREKRWRVAEVVVRGDLAEIKPEEIGASELAPILAPESVAPARPTETAPETPAEAPAAEHTAAETPAEAPAAEHAAPETPAEAPAAEHTAPETPAEAPAAEHTAPETSEETPSEETPAEALPVEHTAPETPSEETPAEETPAEETPAEEAGPA